MFTKQKFQHNTGFEPNIVCECLSVAIIIALVVPGMGATILPKSVMSSFPISEIKMLVILDATFQSVVGIVRLRERHLSKSAQALSILLRKIIIYNCSL
ncbi:LysR family transcriptional regulator substrate-binding protein [Bacillus sp. ISL-46]|uniref:LysR family transcriptional regulator substrate-binding protein n=1 Tax=Bacillus sp. ISL-46 TaxID=2819129 RepID=UPI001BED1DD7|nr:LysR family transcriptional regulator substrate-binding protein [Bacillus sp. ISL-46]MBT2722684.1 LysR family transcriptional regulator substrate-binding protein [Bacillus sp. ISL-46]